MSNVNAVDRCLIDGAALVEMEEWEGDDTGTWCNVWFECRATDRHYYHAEYERDIRGYVPTDEEFEDRYPEHAWLKDSSGEREIPPPSPGSDAALALGCRCPVLDNGHGRGYMGFEGMFVRNELCSLHWPMEAAPKATNA